MTDPDTPPEPDSTPVGFGDEGGFRPAGDLRVLVVEDSPGDRWYFSELLRSRSFSVVSCEDAETAWAVFEEDPPPLILLDLLLPGMDGIELCRRIRAHPRGSDCAILAVTGQADPEALTRILAAGANDFIRKPVDPDQLDIRLIIAERWVAEQQERRATQNELTRKTAELETLFRNLPDVFFSVDLEEERLIQISPAALGILGHAPEEMKGDRELWKGLLFPGEGPNQPWHKIRQGILTGPVVHEYELDGGEGATRHLRTNLWVEEGTGGTPARVDGVITDISHQKRINDQLTRRNRELAALNRMAEISLAAGSSKEALDGMLNEITRVLDLPVGAIERLDQARDRLVVGATRGIPLPQGEAAETPLQGTLTGRAVTDAGPVVETDPRIIEARGPTYLREMEPRFVGVFPLLVEGRVRGVLVVAAPVATPLDPHGRTLAMSLANSVAAHVERMATENALRENEARYRRLVAQLKQANTELESFAYSMSHDLRAPLRTMQGFAHALLQNFGETLDDEARDYAERIIASGKQSEALISDLLTYSRLSLERLDLKPVELRAVVETALDQLQGDLADSGAEVAVEGPLPTVLGSRALLVQVMTNLLANAVKFVPETRAPEITVRTEEVDGDVRVWVEDNGVGIPPDQRERIFRVFERLAGNEGRPGTGIGLAIVRRGVQRIGGSCGIEDLPDGGTAFWIQIPRERREKPRPWSHRR